jgi:hypothetical protein
MFGARKKEERFTSSAVSHLAFSAPPVASFSPLASLVALAVAAWARASLGSVRVCAAAAENSRMGAVEVHCDLALLDYSVRLDYLAVLLTVDSAPRPRVAYSAV